MNKFGKILTALVLVFALSVCFISCNNNTVQTDYSAEIKELQNQIDSLKSSDSSGADKISELESALAAAKQQLSDLESKGKSDNETLKQQIADLKTELAAAKSDNETLKQQITDLQTRLLTSETYNETLKLQITDLQTRLLTAESDNTTLKQQITDLQTRLLTAESDNTTLKQQITELQTNFSDGESDNETLKQQITDLKTALETAESNNKILQTEIDNLKAQVGPSQFIYNVGDAIPYYVNGNKLFDITFSEICKRTDEDKIYIAFKITSTDIVDIDNKDFTNYFSIFLYDPITNQTKNDYDVLANCIDYYPLNSNMSVYGTKKLIILYCGMPFASIEFTI